MLKVGERIKECREKLGLTQDELAQITGYKSRSSINKIEKGGNDLPQSKIVAFAKALKTTPAYLMGWEDEKPNASIPPSDKVHMIPIFGSVAAGFGAYADSDILGYMPLVVENSYDVENTLIIKVEGESMYPTICDGDKIVVRKQDSVDNGRIAVVMIGDEAVVKRIECDKNKLTLHSINPMFSPRVIEGEALADCRIVGLVQQVIKAV